MQKIEWKTVDRMLTNLIVPFKIEGEGYARMRHLEIISLDTQRRFCLAPEVWQCSPVL